MPTDRPDMIVKDFIPAETNFTPGEDSDVSYVTTDIVDHDREVIVSAGIDFASVFMKNPVVLARHDQKTWPIGRCEWIKVAKATASRRFNGLIAKTIYDQDPDAQRVFGMVKRLVVKGKSITATPPDDMKPGEWGPPTREEIKARPDWANAKRIIRRSVLVEYSVVPVPANKESLVLAVSKGLVLPTYLRGVVVDEMKSEIEGEAVEFNPEASGIKVNDQVDFTFDGKAQTGRLSEFSKSAQGKWIARIVAPDKPDGFAGFQVPAELITKAMTESASTEGGAATKPETAKPLIKSGDYVEWGAGRKGMCGKCMSIHKAGKVTGVPEEVEGSEDDPAAKVKVYKQGDDGKHRPTERVMGRKVSALSKIPHEMEGDMAEEEGEAEKPAPKPKAMTTLAALPPLPACRTRAEAEEEYIGEVARKAMDSLYGVI